MSRQLIEVLSASPLSSYSASDSLTFNEVAAAYTVINVYDTLTFNEFVPLEFSQEITDTLTLWDWPYRVRIGTFSETLDFVEDNFVFNMIHDFWPTGDYLTFTEVVDVENGNWKFVPQTLTFSETIEWQGPHYIEIAHYISFQETFWYNNNWRRTVNDVLTLVHYAGRPYNITISDSLTFTEDGRR
jgi:hypothetical protein